MNSSQRGAFVDNKGVRWDTNDSDFEGFLGKQSRWVREWRKRYFVLKGSKLFFTKNPQTAPHGMIDLVDCISAKSADNKAKKKNAFEVLVNDDSYLLQASSEKEKDNWIAHIGRAIVTHSSVYVPVEEEGEDEFTTHSIDVGKFEKFGGDSDF